MEVINLKKPVDIFGSQKNIFENHTEIQIGDSRRDISSAALWQFLSDVTELRERGNLHLVLQQLCFYVLANSSLVQSTATSLRRCLVSSRRDPQDGQSVHHEIQQACHGK